MNDVVPRDDGLDERVGCGVRDLVVEVALRDPGRVAAQPVVDRAVGGDRVQDERSQAEIRLERGVDRLGDGAARVAAREDAQPLARFVERDLFPVERDPDRREQLREEPFPRAGAGERLLRAHALLALGQQVRLEAADGLEVVANALELGGSEQRRCPRVVGAGPLELEEAKLVLDRGLTLARASEQARERFVLRVRVEAELGEQPHAVAQTAQPFELVHRARELGRLELRDPPRVALAERSRVFERSVRVALDRGVVQAFVERGEIPRDVFCRRAHLRSFCASRRDVNQTPSASTPSMYATWIRSSQPTVPSVRSRIRSTPW